MHPIDESNLETYPQGRDPRFLRVLASQNVVVRQNDGVATDSTSHDLYELLLVWDPGCSIGVLPNDPRLVERMLSHSEADLLVLVGGNDVGSVAVRDYSESAALDWAMKNHVPVLAICRGFQMLNLYLGGRIESHLCRLPTQELLHAGSQHSIQVSKEGVEILNLHTSEFEVNSFHNHGVALAGLAPTLTQLAHSPDGLVEAAWAVSPRLIGLQWHPERPGAPVELSFAIMDWLTTNG